MASTEFVGLAAEPTMAAAMASDIAIVSASTIMMSSAATTRSYVVSDVDSVPTIVAPQSQYQIMTRLRNNIRTPRVRTDGTNPTPRALSATVSEPTTHVEALTHDDWKGAMNTEYVALIKNHTWHLIPPRK